ncbi:MAG TPA: hypothetical protein ENI19_02340 [Candidatus Nealsonbacteria bacterium]|uniref:HPr kinase/phosphorylase C-terminal domain-containing protein n=1 Tax=marine sediment metagenome TaxID=412755 RepID=A0A0F9YEE9_9ZZZZ|nr:hypothetical protein [Candidatus Nealsonbacteria bacterium]HEB46526.1 hypothetical protein [Candidatus Nealsonbacteria bacterium]
MSSQAKFLCSLWQGKHGVDIYSSTQRILPSLKNADLVAFIPGYTCKQDLINAGYSICYYDQEKFSLTCSADNKSVVVTGDLELIVNGEVIPYLAYALLEMQRQAAGQTSVHTAAVSLNGRGVLLMGKEGAGKTSMALHLCCEYGYKLVANDIAIIGYDRGQTFIYEGTKFFWLRLDPMEKHHPDLVKFFLSSGDRDPWTNRTIVHPHQIGVEIETETVPIAAVFFLHVYESAAKLHVERSLNRWPHLYLYENFSRYIRRTCSPMMGGKDFHYLAYLPSLDTPDFHANRVKIIDHFIEDIGIYYVAGQLKDIGSTINQAIS